MKESMQQKKTLFETHLIYYNIANFPYHYSSTIKFCDIVHILFITINIIQRLLRVFLQYKSDINYNIVF